MQRGRQLVIRLTARRLIIFRRTCTYSSHFVLGVLVRRAIWFLGVLVTFCIIRPYAR